MPDPSVYTSRYQDVVIGLARRLEAAAAAVWARYDGIDDSTADQWVKAMLPLVLATQTRTVRLTYGYLVAFVAAAVGGRPAAGLVPIEGLQLRDGPDPGEVWRRPVITARAAVSRGEDYSRAREIGLARARQTARTEVTLAARGASHEFLRSDDRITGYRRVTTGKSCDLCVSASSKPYRSEDIMPIHGGCDCTAEPVFGPVSSTFKGDDTAKVVTHDELGPMLWSAEHHFDEI